MAEGAGFELTVNLDIPCIKIAAHATSSPSPLGSILLPSTGRVGLDWTVAFHGAVEPGTRYRNLVEIITLIMMLSIALRHLTAQRSFSGSLATDRQWRTDNCI